MHLLYICVCNFSKSIVFKEMFWVIGIYPNASQLRWPKPSEVSINYKTEFLPFRKCPLIQEIHLQNCFHYLQIQSEKVPALQNLRGISPEVRGREHFLPNFNCKE